MFSKKETAFVITIAIYMFTILNVQEVLTMMKMVMKQIVVTKNVKDVNMSKMKLDIVV